LRAGQAIGERASGQAALPRLDPCLPSADTGAPPPRSPAVPTPRFWKLMAPVKRPESWRSPPPPPPKRRYCSSGCLAAPVRHRLLPGCGLPPDLRGVPGAAARFSTRAGVLLAAETLSRLLRVRAVLAGHSSAVAPGPRGDLSATGRPSDGPVDLASFGVEKSDAVGCSVEIQDILRRDGDHLRRAHFRGRHCAC